MAHKPWITAEFVTVCSSLSVVSNTSCSHFFGQWSYWSYTHAFTKLHTKVMSCAYECRYMHATYLKQTQLPCMICSVSSPPLSVMVRSCHACVNLSHLHSLGFLHADAALWQYPSPTWQQAGHIACTKLPGLHKIFKYGHLKFTVYGRKHTYTQLPPMQSR